MLTVIESLREVLGQPVNADLEYIFGGIILCIVVGSIFKILVRWFDR